MDPSILYSKRWVAVCPQETFLNPAVARSRHWSCDGEYSETESRSKSQRFAPNQALFNLSSQRMKSGMRLPELNYWRVTNLPLSSLMSYTQGTAFPCGKIIGTHSRVRESAAGSDRMMYLLVQKGHLESSPNMYLPTWKQLCIELALVIPVTEAHSATKD